MNKKIDKLFESLPRQSTVDQLKRIRDEIKKSQEIKVGPETTHMKGDVGDRVIGDLIKHKEKQEVNNLFWWDNPLDRYICSYEDFVEKDSRDSLGYTQDGDPNKHKGTDFVKEGVKPIEDPYGEEIWDDDDDITKKIKSKILNFIGDKYKDRIIEKFFPELNKYQGQEEKYYEIRGDFGDHILDTGKRIGIVRARSKAEARAIFVLSRRRKDYVDVLLTGFYRPSVISQAEFEKELENAKKYLRLAQKSVDNLENTSGPNNI